MENTTTTQLDSLEAVTGKVEQSTIPIQGEVLTLTPVKFKNMGDLIVACTPIMGQVKMLELNKLQTGKADAETVIKLGNFLVEYKTEITTALALMSGKSEDWVGECDANEVTDLFLKCITVNIDFFIRRWFPSLLQHMQTIKNLTSLAGLNKSKG